MHTILEKNGLAVFDVTTGEIIHRVNKFGDHFVAIRDRNRRRLKRRVKDNQKHNDMQEERDHAQTQMIVVGKSVRLSDFNKKGLIGKGTYGIICQYESKRSGRKYAIKHAADSYFLNSSYKIRFFFEEGAVDKNGELTVPKDKTLNKIVHGLHFLNPTFNTKIRKVFKEIGYQEPEVVRSMYIFKQPKIGGAVTDHVDSTFLRVDPIDHLTGVWIAIDEASVENGCLSFIPGSYKDTSTCDYRFVRTHDTIGGPLLKFIGTRKTYDQFKFQHVPISKGSLILIHGLVVHKSEANTSDKSRHAYTVHVMERKSTKWSEDNWLQEA
ncbi:hypothetical protein GCK72_012255 [Caenorhabditis remanei]|uniref:Uncharacterized protein n=1 Tax=Caenorhabditis remanei TaxID=31234 RepID=A0A6A5GMN8_CAERE|nr:hypothetical protein GCK72_012255 [Caenorhabditis remanei]KAF1755805.1 hypothetical protein GCK72_012255 [Caenorhabditis remanei]